MQKRLALPVAVILPHLPVMLECPCAVVTILSPLRQTGFPQRIHCGCSTGKSFSQHLLCIYLSTGPIIPSHTGQRGGNTRLITPLPISFILFTNPPDCNIPICNNINKKRQYIPAMQGHIIALTAACYKTYILEFFISLACKELYILSCTDSNTCHRLLCSHCIDACLFLDKLLKTSEQ